MKTDWKEHTIEVRGDWTAKWLYLAPVYTLEIDGQEVDEVSGPRIRPRLKHTFEASDDEYHEVLVDILSIAGIRPKCDITIDDKVVDSDRVPVRNLLNPALILFITASIGFMLYIGPQLLRRYLL